MVGGLHEVGLWRIGSFLTYLALFRKLRGLGFAASFFGGCRFLKNMRFFFSVFE